MPRISYDADPKNKNAKVKKQKKTPQVRESGRNSLFVVMLIIIVGWCTVFASNKDIAFISTIIGLIDHFIGPITIAGIVLLIIVAKFTGNLKLGSGEKATGKRGIVMLILALRREILSAVVAVLQEAAVHPAVGDRNALNLYSTCFVEPSRACPANCCAGAAPTSD